MAFGEIKNTGEVKEGFSSKKYVGIMPVEVIAVNPSSAKLTEIYGREMEAPEYTGKTEYTHPVKGDVTTIKTARIDLILQNKEYDFLHRLTFFLQDTPWVSKEGKCQVIDKFGNTTWVTEEQFKKNEIPVLANGRQVTITTPYTPALRNEETLIKFLKYYFGIQDSHNYENETWVLKQDTSRCEAKLDKIKNYFNGDFSELIELFKLASFNKIKVLLGVKLSEGKTYQDVFTSEFMRNNSNSVRNLQRAVESAHSRGGYPNTLFKYFGEAKEYTPEATLSSRDPFEAPAVNPFKSAAQTVAPDSPNDLPF